MNQWVGRTGKSWLSFEDRRGDWKSRGSEQLRVCWEGRSPEERSRRGLRFVERGGGQKGVVLSPPDCPRVSANTWTTPSF